MKSAMIIFMVVFAARCASAQDYSCSEPAQSCAASNGDRASIESCSVTCAEGVAPVCVAGAVIEMRSRPSCLIESENRCYCAGEDRQVETLGDHE